jgi:chorismate synthase
MRRSYLAKYGIKASSGGGRSSARETIGRVAAGAVAEKYLRDALGVEIVAWVSSVGDVAMTPQECQTIVETVTRDMVDQTLVRCPLPEKSAAMQKARC